MTLNKTGYPTLAEMPSEELNIYSDVIHGIACMFAVSKMPEMLEHAQAINARLWEEWHRRASLREANNDRT